MCRQMTDLWSGMWKLPGTAATAAAAPQDDRRFAAEAWAQDPRFDVVKRMYLGYSDFLQKRGRCGAGRRQDEGAIALRGPAVLRGDQPGQFLRHQSRGDAAGGGDRRAKRRRGDDALRRGSGQGPHLDDRRERVRGRQEHRDDRGCRRLRERAHSAHPVRAAHRTGLCAAAGDRSAVHQQVLHPRPAAGEFVRPLRASTQGHTVFLVVVAQHHARAGPSDLGRLPASSA
mgnify:CR=1 FL=1